MDNTETNTLEVNIFNNAKSNLAPCPVGAVRLRLPFVGVYQSPLDGDIDTHIEMTKEYAEADSEVMSECSDGKYIVHIDWMGIFEYYAERTMELLGIKGTYAGCTVPQFFNYDDVNLYVHVTEKHYEELCAKAGFIRKPGNSFDVVLALCNKSEDLFGYEEAKTYDDAAWQLHDKISDRIELCNYVTEYSSKEWNTKQESEKNGTND